MTPVIEIRCDQTGDSAEATSELGALIAARTLCEDAWNGNPRQGFKPTASFFVDGEYVRRLVPQKVLWAAIGASR